jgi:hypothetical protein
VRHLTDRENIRTPEKRQSVFKRQPCPTIYFLRNTLNGIDCRVLGERPNGLSFPRKRESQPED